MVEFEYDTSTGEDASFDFVRSLRYREVEQAVRPETTSAQLLLAGLLSTVLRTQEPT